MVLEVFLLQTKSIFFFPFKSIVPDICVIFLKQWGEKETLIKKYQQGTTG